MNNTFKKIEAILSDNGASPLFSTRFLLLVLSSVYGGAVKLRRTFYEKAVLKSKKLPCIVISVGNITVGGTGKTPMTIYVANLLKKNGYKVAVISRGYKGSYEKAGGIVSDGRSLFTGPEMAGDEPYMLATRLKNVPVVVGKNRFKGGRLAIRKFHSDIIVLDDAFQHLNLQRDIDLVLLDGGRPFGNGRLLPRGVLREPISSLSKANALVLTRSDATNGNRMFSSLKSLERYSMGTPVFKASHVPFVCKVGKDNNSTYESLSQGILKDRSEYIKGHNVFIFSGLADNRNFRRTIERLKCNISGVMEFPDHHAYSEKDLENILEAAQKNASDGLITTEKDYVRIACRIEWPLDLFVVRIEIAFGDDTERFHNFIIEKLEKRKELR